MFEGFIRSTDTSSLDLRRGALKNPSGCTQDISGAFYCWCNLIYRMRVPKKLYTSLLFVLFLRSLSCLTTEPSLSYPSSAHLNMVPLSNRGASLSGCSSLLFPTAPLNHFIFITCLAGAQSLTFDSLRPTWDRDEIDCQECGRGGKEECNAG